VREHHALQERMVQPPQHAVLEFGWGRQGCGVPIGRPDYDWNCKQKSCNEAHREGTHEAKNNTRNNQT